jgi:hypothetical protein
MGSVVWSTELLALLKAPPTPANYRFVNQWATREHNGGPALSDGSNNPFFTTAGAGGTVGPLKSGMFPEWNTVGVARYPSLSVGVYANALHIGSEYPAIAAALRSGNPAAYATNAQFQSELSRWSGGGYAGFASIPAAAGPVGPTVDIASVPKDIAAAVTNKIDHPGGLGGVLSGAANHIPGVVQAKGAIDAVSATSKFLGRLTDPAYILRGLQVVAGGGLVAIGAVLLARQVALAADLPDPLANVAPGGASSAGRIADTTSVPATFRRPPGGVE